MMTLTRLIVGIAALFPSDMSVATQLSLERNVPRGASASALAPGFEDRYADVNGIRLHYVIGGEGPALLLVPGWPETWWSWRHLMPVLAKDHTLIAVETRGMGESSRPLSGYDMTSVARDLFGLRTNSATSGSASSGAISAYGSAMRWRPTGRRRSSVWLCWIATFLA